MTLGTARQRKIALVAGLALLAVLNYLDFVGFLELAVATGTIALLSSIWTGLAVGLAGPDLEELKDQFRALVFAAVPWAVGVAALGAAYPDAGDHYVIHATGPGQALYAVAPVLSAALTVTGGGVLMAWALEYRELRRTDPEERVLEGTDP